MSARLLSTTLARTCLRSGTPSSLNPSSRRAASTVASPVARVRSGAINILLGVSAGFAVAYFRDPQAAAHEYLVMPVLRAVLDPEEGHRFAIKALQWPIRPKEWRKDEGSLKTEVSLDFILSLDSEPFDLWTLNPLFSSSASTSPIR